MHNAESLQFLEKINFSIATKSFIKITFSKPSRKDLAKNIYGRLVNLKNGEAISFTLRYNTKDITKNYLVGEDLDSQLLNWIRKDFKIVTLITDTEETVLQFNKKNEARIKTLNKLAFKKNEATDHNIEKQYLIPEDAEFLKLLAVSSKEGHVLKEHRDKYKQINKYVEIMKSLLEKSSLPQKNTKIQIVDMGSGKGYLTFALYYLLKEKFDFQIKILGVELRENLCDFCNEQAEKLGWSDNLKFAAMDILAYNEGDIDVLIALHACDTATDIAIAQGIKNAAELIVVAPCCHKQIRKEMHPTGPWKEILKNGILMERQAELITDSLRALYLEKENYQTKVFEFISTQHTPKNVMISASKRSKALSLDEEKIVVSDINGLKDTFGIRTHFLETLL